MKQWFIMKRQSSCHRITQMRITIAETFFSRQVAPTKQSQIWKEPCNCSPITPMPTRAWVTLFCGRARLTRRSRITRRQRHYLRQIRILATTWRGCWRPLPILHFATARKQSNSRSKPWHFRAVEIPLLYGRSPLRWPRVTVFLMRWPQHGRPQVSLRCKAKQSSRIKSRKTLCFTVAICRFGKTLQAIRAIVTPCGRLGPIRKAPSLFAENRSMRSFPDLRLLATLHERSPWLPKTVQLRHRQQQEYGEWLAFLHLTSDWRSPPT